MGDYYGGVFGLERYMYQWLRSRYQGVYKLTINMPSYQLSWLQRCGIPVGTLRYDCQQLYKDYENAFNAG
jgi:hypothetical protein